MKRSQEYYIHFSRKYSSVTIPIMLSLARPVESKYGKVIEVPKVLDD